MSEVINSLLNEQISPEIAPRLLLWQFERVGSTFLLDQLEKQHIVHNEPYKLLIPERWPIARSYDGGLIDVDAFFEDTDISTVDKFWLQNLVLSLHYPAGQVVKETNLFLALPQFLELFPRSQVSLLTRDPRGIISSFKRNGLFERWNYGDVSSLLSRQLTSTRPENYQALKQMADRDAPWQHRLTWLIGLNAVLLSRYVAPETVTEVIEYEANVVPMGEQAYTANQRVQDSIFATNIQKTHDDYETRFSAEELDGINDEIERCAAFVANEFDKDDLRWFDQLFGRHATDGSRRPGIGALAKNLGAVSAATQDVRLLPVDQQPNGEVVPRRLVKLKEDQPLLWSHSLVTNNEISQFLQELLDVGMNPDTNIIMLLDNMPTSRGGRLTYDSENGRFLKAEGYDGHPAYWISWLTAALFAYREGMRLPTYEEWEAAYEENCEHIEDHPGNHTYAHDDVVPTGNGTHDIPDDFFGNLKIWCQDWASEHDVSKKIAGISWKNYDHDGYEMQAERPYLTSSRIIGARMVCCSECGPHTRRGILDVKRKYDEVLQLIAQARGATAAELESINHKISTIICGDECEHKHGAKNQLDNH